jgi:hypothetical protein
MKNILVIISILFMFASCKNYRDKQPLLPAVKGKPGDITTVISNSLWETSFGDSVRSVFYEEIYGLPEIEPLYDLLQVSPSNFSNIFKGTRNILIFEISKSYDSSNVIIQRDLWAKPQMLIKVIAPSEEEALAIFMEKSDKIVNIFNDIERKRFTETYRKSQDNGLRLRLEKKHNITITIPNGYKMGMDSANFTWIDLQQPNNITQGLFIYEYPYTDENTFTVDYIIEKRNDVLREYVEGQDPGSYMTTEMLLPPKLTAYAFKEKYYIADVRGLWKMQNGQPMGGPFLSYTLLDEERNRIITVEGYIFAPGSKKRTLIKQLEAILSTIDVLPVNPE